MVGLLAVIGTTRCRGCVRGRPPGPSPTEAEEQSEIVGLDGGMLGVGSGQVGILEEGDEVFLGGPPGEP